MAQWTPYPTKANIFISLEDGLLYRKTKVVVALFLKDIPEDYLPYYE